MPRSAPQRPPSFRNQDFTDRELLANIHDALNIDGYATTTEIAVACGYTGNGQKYMTPARKIANRLVWMREGGLIESIGPDMRVPAHEPGARDTRWRLTDVGEEIRQGSLSRSVDSAIERMDAGSQILMMRRLTQRGYVQGERAVAFALRREYLHQTAQRAPLFRRGR